MSKSRQFNNLLYKYGISKDHAIAVQLGQLKKEMYEDKMNGEFKNHWIDKIKHLATDAQLDQTLPEDVKEFLHITLTDLIERITNYGTNS